MTHKSYGIIWDMDNTILQSHIDFSVLHTRVCGYLKENHILTADYESITTAEALMKMKTFPHYQEEWGRVAWNIVREVEKLGMTGAKLEPGVKEVLTSLSPQVYMVVLTNNSQLPAEIGLAENGVTYLFDAIYGRESVPDLKPSSLGVKQILGDFPHVPADNWLLIGDAGIDARAAIGAGVAFGSFTGSRQEDLQAYQPVVKFDRWNPNCVQEILGFFASGPEEHRI